MSILTGISLWSMSILKSELGTHSLICYSVEDLPLVKFRLLIVLKKRYSPADFREPRYSLEDLFQLVNLRYLDIKTNNSPSSNPSSVSLWNLQTLIIHDYCNNRSLPPEIWKIHYLRHVKFTFPHVFDPPKFSQNVVVLENLQTLAGIDGFKCSKEMVKGIPNVEKLVISYYDCKPGLASDHCLNNLVLLHTLESLCCTFNTDPDPRGDGFLHNLSFPSSLKKLTLRGTYLYWEEINTKLGSLSLLQVLKLGCNSIIGPLEWETIDGQFPNLKYLQIEFTDLECWTAESSHFPCLEHLVLKGLDKLKEIPSGVGEIPTLESIHLDGCSDSAIISAKQILDEHEDLGNEGFQVEVQLWHYNDQHLESLASHNFQVKTFR